MRTKFESVALTLASLGVLAAAPAMAATHGPNAAGVRAGITAGVSQSAPQGTRTLEAMRRRWSSADQEDALSTALLKTLRTRPNLFEGDEDELCRYLEVAARNCLRDALARSHRKDASLDWPVEDGDVSDETDELDLRTEIERRLGVTECRVLSAMVDDGERRTRGIARRVGISRYRAGLALDRIREVTAGLESAA